MSERRAAGSRATAAQIWRQDGWVRPFFRRYRAVLALSLGLGLATFLFAAGLMFTSGYLISGAAALPASILLLNIPLMFVRIFGIGKPVIHYLERLSSHDWVLRMTSSLRLKLYRSIEKDALFFRALHRTGDILGLLSEDIGHIQNLYLRTVFPTVIAWVLLAVVVGIAGFFSPLLGLGMLVMLGSVALVVPLVSVLANAARRARYKALRAELYAELTDNVLGVADWTFSQRGNDYLMRYQDTECALRDIVRSESRFGRRRDFVVQILLGLTSVLILVWAAVAFGGRGGDAGNWIAAAVLSFFPLIEAFVPLPSAAVDAVSYADSIERLNALPPEGEADGSGSAAQPRDPYDICIEEVSYRYPGSQRCVLDGLTLHVAPGEKVALLGRSGAGKSTLMSIVRGDIEPTEGIVTVGGVQASLLGDDASRYVGVIQQQTYLFNMTLFENVRIGRSDATEDEVADVLAKVGLGDLVSRLPAGLQTMVDEAGMRFSGGERHRIALARVLLQDVPIVILDEPTVGLDPSTERALLETLFEVLEGKTVIMVTHHLLGVSLMDRVVFMEDGRISLAGAPSHLERTSERYRMLKAFDRGIGMPVGPDVL